MKRGALCFLFFAILFCWKSAAAGVERPVWKIGDSWILEVRKDGKVLGKQFTKVVEADDSGYTTEVISYNGVKSLVRYNRDLNVVKVKVSGLVGSREFHPHDSKFYWNFESGIEMQKFFSWSDDLGGKVRRNEVVELIRINQESEEIIKVSRFIRDRNGQSNIEERDEFTFSLGKGFFQYRRQEVGGHIYEFELK
jgi:hypothetical protein